MLLFLTGASLGLGLHESGHVIADLGFGEAPGVKKVSFGPFPFFAITHDPVSPGKEAVISSAGFWSQYLTSELILTKHPRLREERGPLMKGILAFHVLTSTGYGIAACAGAGPGERDTNGMARSAGVDECAIGAAILAPAALDAVRYYFPRYGWVRWVSRAAKVGSMVFAIKAG